MLGRRTKIVATLGPATDPPGVLDRLVAAGVNCARLNCSHGTHEDLRRRAASVRATAERAQRPLGLLFDLQGPKLRLSAETETRALRAGEAVVFCGTDGSDAHDRVRVDFAHFAALTTERSQIVIGDGVPRLAVERVAAGDVFARVLSPGALSARKGVNVTYARPELPAITEKDAADLALAAELGADFVALSFVRTADDLEQLKAQMHGLSCPARVVAKIEKIEAYERLDEIIGVADGVMVARGDYGVEAGVAHVPLMQKDTIARATQAGKLVITATQMLESMIHAPEPTRAEATDVANAVIDGSSAVMLSAETSVGSYPVEAVQAMAEIAEAAEQAPEIHGRARKVTPDTAAAVVMRAAVELAQTSMPTRSSSPPPPAGLRGRARSTGRGAHRRAGARPPHRRPAHARVGRPPLPHARRRIRRRHDRGRPDRRTRLRRAPDRRARDPDRGPTDRHTRSDQSDHGAGDPLRRPIADSLRP